MKLERYLVVVGAILLIIGFLLEIMSPGLERPAFQKKIVGDILQIVGFLMLFYPIMKVMMRKIKEEAERREGS